MSLFFTLAAGSAPPKLAFVRRDLRLPQEVACSLWEIVLLKRVFSCLALTLKTFSSSDFTAIDGSFGDFSLFDNIVGFSLTPEITSLSFLTTLMPPMLERMGVFTVANLRLLDFRLTPAWCNGQFFLKKPLK
jgi:hypothetical protein